MQFGRNIDHYPSHWLLHFMHALEIVGYHHPNSDWGQAALIGYYGLCRALHVGAETREQLDGRLDAVEDSFRQQQV